MNVSPWPHRLALATLICTLLLVAFGSLVTTFTAGMAVKGWWIVEGQDGAEHFLLFFPGHEWTRDPGTFYEHTHRMIGTVVGVVAILTALSATFAARAGALGRKAVVVCWVALLAIAIQGAIGGFRVLENSPGLAFLHGVLGQLTFAVIGLAVMATSHLWQTSGPGRAERAPVGLAWATSVFALIQIGLGAWYRHGLRNPDVPLAPGSLHMHITGAVVLLGFVIALAIAVTFCARAIEEREPELARRLLGAKKQLHALIGIQIVLGLAALVAKGGDEVTLAESAIALCHVVVGALILARTLSLVFWLERAREGGAAGAGAA